MKSTLLLIACFFLFNASKCKKEGEDCHRTIIIKNNSAFDILYGWKIKNTGGDCNLSLTTIKSTEVFNLNRRSCWENILSEGDVEEVFIIDPIHSNKPNVFYPCDSIEFKNTILKHFVLSLEELKKNDFVVNFP